MGVKPLLCSLAAKRSDIANLLQHQRIGYLGVAFADKGIALRDAGIRVPLIVPNPALGNNKTMIAYNPEEEAKNSNCTRQQLWKPGYHKNIRGWRGVDFINS